MGSLSLRLQDLPNPWTEPRSLAAAGEFFNSWATREHPQWNKGNIFLQPILFGQFSVSILKDALATPKDSQCEHISEFVSFVCFHCYGLLGIFLPSVSRLRFPILVYEEWRFLCFVHNCFPESPAVHLKITLIKIVMKSQMKGDFERRPPEFLTNRFRFICWAE